MLYIGMYYITGAFLINLFVVKLILFKASYDKANHKKLLKTIGLMFIKHSYCSILLLGCSYGLKHSSHKIHQSNDSNGYRNQN